MACLKGENTMLKSPLKGNCGLGSSEREMLGTASLCASSFISKLSPRSGALIHSQALVRFDELDVVPSSAYEYREASGVVGPDLPSACLLLRDTEEPSDAR